MTSSGRPQRDPGAADTFESAVLPLAGELQRRAYGYTHNVADAEDLVQETLLRAYRAYDRLGDDSNLRAWLWCILRNVWISRYRAAQCRPGENLVGDFDDEQLAAVAGGAGQSARSAEHLVLRDVADPRVRAALSELPDAMRETVYYIAVAGMSCREVAAVMGVAEGTVMSRMHRGRHRLRQSLHDCAPAGTTRPGTRRAERRTPTRRTPSRI